MYEDLKFNLIVDLIRLGSGDVKFGKGVHVIILEYRQ